MLKRIVPELCRPLLALSTLLLVSGCAVHPPAPRVDSNVTVSGRVVVGDEHARVAVLFSSDDRRYINDYYQRERERYRKKGKRKALPPGLAKRDQLPPGLQKQIRRDGQLPAGLQGERLPEELEQRLSPLPANYLRLQVGRDIVLMDQRSRVTVDVIKNFYPD